MTKRVLLVGDSLLETPCHPVDLENTPCHDLERVVLDMTETMNAENGIGLAANQIGYAVRVFILKRDDKSVAEYINPTILGTKEPTQFEGEACLSIPGVSTTTTRFNEVALSWIDKHGTQHAEVFKGMKAFAIQHEMDHLDGKLYLDQFGPVKRNLLIKKHKKFLKNQSSRR